MNFKAIFWDNDGVLVDTEPLFFEATRRILKAIGVELTRDHYVQHQLRRNASAFDLALEKGVTREEIECLREKRNQLYSDLMTEKGIPVRPGIPKVLKKLHGRLKMAVVTSSRREHFEIIMRSAGLLKFFDFVITAEDVKNMKPDPEPYLMALEKSGFSPRECLVIEDTERGVTAAKAAGLCCFAFPTVLSAGNDFSGADRMLRNPGELINLLT